MDTFVCWVSGIASFMLICGLITEVLENREKKGAINQ